MSPMKILYMSKSDVVWKIQSDGCIENYQNTLEMYFTSSLLQRNYEQLKDIRRTHVIYISFASGFT
jgi:hypothetical protein